MFRKICGAVLVRLVLVLFFLFAAGAANPARGAVLTEALSSWRTSETPIDTAYSQDGRRIFILSDQGNVLVYSAEGRLEETIPVSPVFDGLDVSPNGELLYLVSSKRKMFRTISLTFQAEIDISESPFLGSPEAPVVVVVFSDFQCPSCAQVSPIIEQILEAYPGQVRIVYKNFPLRFHPLAAPAALAALAAGEQGRFWEFHDRLFEHYSELSSERIIGIARELGLDMVRFEKDRISKTIVDRLNKDIIEGRRLAVAGTPTVFINGWRLKEGASAAIRKIIDQELRKTGNAAQGKNKK